MTRRLVYYGLILSAALLLTTSARVWLPALFDPASSYMSSSSVEIPNFKVGEDPLVKYRLTVNKDFDGQYIVTVWDRTTGRQLCVGSSPFPYQTRHKGRDMPLSQYVDRNCHYVSGHTYYAVTEYKRVSERGLEDVRSHVSNDFTVQP